MASIDDIVTTDLLETLEDGRKRLSAAADRLAASRQPELASTFRGLAFERAGLVRGLERFADDDTIDTSGSMLGKLRRGWLALTDALTGDEPGPVIELAVRGEDRVVAAYELALGQEISAELRSMVEHQLEMVRATRDRVEAVRSIAV